MFFEIGFDKVLMIQKHKNRIHVAILTSRAFSMTRCLKLHRDKKRQRQIPINYKSITGFVAREMEGWNEWVQNSSVSEM